MTMANETPSPFAPQAESADIGAESLGAWLARVRAGHGAEQRDVARHLGLNPTIIQALETDDFGRLGPPVFVRGYLSRYARLLNLPEQVVLERYQRQSGPSQEPPPLKVVHPIRRQTRVRDLRGLFYLLLVIGIGWTAIQHLGDFDPGRLLALWSGDSQDNGGPTATPPATPMTVTTQTHYPFQSTPAEVASTSPAPSPVPLAVEQPAATPEPASPAPGAAAPPPAAPAAAPSSPAEPATVPATPGTVTATVATVLSAPGSTPESGGASPAAEARLLLEFSNDCWVEVKDAQGNVLVNGLMKANSTRTLSGAAPFKVTLGNAPAARIILDDRLVDTEFYMPRRGTVSRFTLDRGQP